MTLRKILVTFVGHVDHGKTSILDRIRATTMVEREAGKITQAIGASIIPIETINRVCGDLLKTLKLKITIPGILAIDTPGHAAFSNLRKRGGNLADIAVLVIDIREGFMPQTLECIDILKTYKTPFVIAANKIDLLAGWQTKKLNLIQSINQQSENIRTQLDTKVYEIVGKLSELNFQSERFDRVNDYTEQIAIVPLSAKTGDGIPELLMVLTGLAQKYFEKRLHIYAEAHAKGTVLEVKEEKGLGTTLDVIIYDGNLKKHDILVIGSLEKPIVTKLRALFEPMPLSEMRDKKSKFKSVDKVIAATGVKIIAQNIERAIAGMPLRSCSEKDIVSVKEEIQKEIEEVIIDTDKEGIIIKADSLGSLEALIRLLKEKNIAIRKADIGDIIKKDIYDAETNFEKDPLKSVVLGFNVQDSSGICLDKVKVITNNIIYKIIEDFEKWKQQSNRDLEIKRIEVLTKPCKVEILKGYIFRQSNPAIVGVDILVGTLEINTPLMKADGKILTEVKEIQLDKENIHKAEKGKQVAISLPKVTVGRQIQEGDILYSAIPEEDFRKFKELKQYLSKDEIEVLKEIAEIRRKDNPMWGV
jgi:translation initiation factor 5B